MDKQTEDILRRRMHGLYLSRGCWDIVELSRELLGLHCWFHRNVAFSSLIRGCGLVGWKTALTKTWLYRGTLHGAVYEELPLLLALHADEAPWSWFGLPEGEAEEVAQRVLYLMEDGIYSRAEMRQIFADSYDTETVSRLFSPWGGIFVYLARRCKVAFRNMTSRDFDLIGGEPILSQAEALERLLPRFFEAYGPASTEDAAWFFGVDKAMVKESTVLEGLEWIERGRERLYYVSDEDMEDIPHLTLLSGFDPYLVSYVNREAALPPEYKKAVVLKSGICLPTIAIDGVVAGIWNLKNKEPEVEFFARQPKALREETLARVEQISWGVEGRL
ncbi:MAG: winged helix DNA-binding domain-containing protein [Oscillospiraceae bacterium]|nr:winged helix DNA-binding domain-containing protein [Oscillospiraceae bacterium]